MTCTICGRYAEPDRETGYDVDDVCPVCSSLGEQSQEAMRKFQQLPQEAVDPIESDLHDLGSVLASLADLVKDCHDPAKLFDIYCELGKLSKAMMELQDAVGTKQFRAQWGENGERVGQ